MSASDACESDLLKLLFQNITWANIGDATGLVVKITSVDVPADRNPDITFKPGKAE
jgi:hypothetical protein